MTTVENISRSVAICDTQPLIVEGLRALLENTSSYRLMKPSATLEDLSHLLITSRPDIAVVDKALGNSAVMDWISRVNLRASGPVIVWGVSLTDAEALRFLQAGARGILRKTARPDSLIACFDAISNGGTWMDDNLFRAGASGPDQSFRPELTAREQQVLELVEQGMRNKEIALELGIRPGTVKIHLKHIFEKSGVRGRYGLALSSIRDRSPLTAVAV